MKKLKSILAVGGFSLLLAFSPIILTTGCRTTPTQQRVAVDTLFTVHKSVDLVMDSYLDMVVTKKISTNSLARVSNGYDNFQIAYRVAVETVAGDTNAVAPQNLINAASNFSATVNKAKETR